jgi:hypothetical protein
MNLGHKLLHELEAVALTTLFFGTWAAVLVVLKTLVLADYQIEFRGFTAAAIGTLVLAKVVLILQHVPLGSWIEHRPRAVDIVVRTALYGSAALVVMLLEKAFEARHEYGGFSNSLVNVFQHRDINHVWVNAICLACALLAFNAFTVVRDYVGGRELARLFFASPESLGVRYPHPGTHGLTGVH